MRDGEMDKAQKGAASLFPFIYDALNIFELNVPFVYRLWSAFEVTFPSATVDVIYAWFPAAAAKKRPFLLTF